MSDELPPGDVTSDAAPVVPPAGETAPQPAGGTPWVLLGAAAVACLAFGAIMGIRIGRALTMREPGLEVIKLPCEECAERKRAEAIAATSPSDVERLVAMQEKVEHAGADDN